MDQTFSKPKNFTLNSEASPSKDDTKEMADVGPSRMVKRGMDNLSKQSTTEMSEACNDAYESLKSASKKPRFSEVSPYEVLMEEVAAAGPSMPAAVKKAAPKWTSSDLDSDASKPSASRKPCARRSSKVVADELGTSGVDAVDTALAGPSKVVTEEVAVTQPTNTVTNKPKTPIWTGIVKGLTGPSRPCPASQKYRFANGLPMYEFKYETFEKVTYKSNFIPHARSGHKIVCTKKYLYSYGGYNTNVKGRATPILRELLRYNFYLAKWEVVIGSRGLPSELVSSGACLVENFMVIHGGTGVPFGASFNERTFLIDVNLKKPVLKTFSVTGTMPDDLYGQEICEQNASLYVVGGTDGTFYSIDIHQFNLITKNWEEIVPSTGLENIPYARYGHQVVGYENRIYVLGGGRKEHTYSIKVIPVFDLATYRWSLVVTHKDPNVVGKGFPAHRRHHAISQDKNKRHKVYVMGGRDGRTFYSDTWLLNLRNMSWKRIVKMEYPRPVFFHSAHATPNGCVYSYGGCVPTSPNSLALGHPRTNEMYRAWTSIPKLIYMVWDAVSYYRQNGLILHADFEKLVPLELRDLM